METKEKDNLIFIRLFKDEDVYSCLKQACQKHNVKTGVFLSGLGQLKEFELGFFKEKGNYMPEKYNIPHELVLLTGNVALGDNDYDFHLHALLSNEKKQTVGGHFIQGIISVTGEIIILKSTIEVKRETEEWNGLKGLFLE